MEEPTTQTPPGWSIAGSLRAAYVAGVDPNVKRGDSPSGYLRSTKPVVDGFGTLVQDIASDKYVGARIGLSCYLKTADVSGWCGLWMRVDADRDDPPIAFDNMEDRAIRGTTDWTECVVVLDVGKRAKSISFGVLLSGTGTVWIDQLKFDLVDDTVPLTSPPNFRDEPRNLDFSGLSEPPQFSDSSANEASLALKKMRGTVSARNSADNARCSFCNAYDYQVEKMICAGDRGPRICSTCVSMCVEVLNAGPVSADK